MKLYGLRTKDTHEMIGVYTESNHPGEFCVDVCFRAGGEIPYLVCNKKYIEETLEKETDWWEASYTHPIISKKERDNLEIFEIKIPCKGFYLC